MFEREFTAAGLDWPVLSQTVLSLYRDEVAYGRPVMHLVRACARLRTASRPVSVFGPRALSYQRRLCDLAQERMCTLCARPEAILHRADLAGLLRDAQWASAAMAAYQGVEPSPGAEENWRTVIGRLRDLRRYRSHRADPFFDRSQAFADALEASLDAMIAASDELNRWAARLAVRAHYRVAPIPADVTVTSLGTVAAVDAEFDRWAQSRPALFEGLPAFDRLYERWNSDPLLTACQPLALVIVDPVSMARRGSDYGMHRRMSAWFGERRGIHVLSVQAATLVAAWATAAGWECAVTPGLAPERAELARTVARQWDRNGVSAADVADLAVAAVA